MLCTLGTGMAVNYMSFGTWNCPCLAVNGAIYLMYVGMQVVLKIERTIRSICDGRKTSTVVN